MNIGSMWHRVTLKTPGSPVPDGDGGYTQSDTLLGYRMPASVEEATARSLERLVANTVASSATHLVRMRYLPGVTTNTLLVFHDGLTDRLMSVTGPHDIGEKHVELVLECVEQVT